MARQQNIIFYDSNEKIEHFIRKADFTVSDRLGNVPSLGFVAPTPSVPKIEGVTEKLYEKVSDIIATERAIRRSRAGLESWRNNGTYGSASGSVRVVQTVQVSGYIAETVIATDTPSLSRWIKENNYGNLEAGEEWFDFYIKKKWYLTLFKLDKVGSRTQTGAVKMSFKTNRIYNPYYVPKGNSADRAFLKVTLITDKPVTGKLGDKPWSKPDFGMMVGFKKLEQLCLLAKVPIPESDTNYLTVFYGQDFAKGAKEDLYFDFVKNEKSVQSFYGLGSEAFNGIESLFPDFDFLETLSH